MLTLIFILISLPLSLSLTAKPEHEFTIKTKDYNLRCCALAEMYRNPETKVHLVYKNEMYQFPAGPVPGCTQIVLSSFMSDKSCSLSPHCKNTTYTTLESYWFSEVGVCMGIGSDAVPTRINNLVTKQRTKHIHLGSGWCKHYGIRFNPNNTEFNPPVFMFQNELAVLECSGRYYLTSRFYMSFLNGIEIVQGQPKLKQPLLIQTLDSRYCSPFYASSNRTYFAGPFNTIAQMLRNTPLVAPYITVEPIYLRQKVGPMVIDDGLTMHYDVYYLKIRNFDATEDFKCNAYSQVTNMLPYGISSIAHAIGHVAINLLYTLVHVIKEILVSLYIYVPPIVYEPLLFSTPLALYTLYRLNNNIMSVIVLVLSTIIITIVKSFH